MSSGVYADIVNKMNRDELKFPTLPDVTQRIHAAVKDPDIGVMDIAKIVQADPGLTAHLLKAVNSVGFRSFRKIKTVQDAVSRLGLQATRYHATIYTVRNLFQQAPSVTRGLMRQHAYESTRLAATSSVLASTCKGIDPDQVMLGALLQDIGVLPLIDWIGTSTEEHEIDNLDAMLHDLASKYAVKIGLLILEKWKFDKNFQEVVRAREDWNRKSGRKLDHGDIINLARIHALGGTAARRKIPHITSLPAFALLENRELTEDRTLQVLAERSDEIMEIQKFLLP